MSIPERLNASGFSFQETAREFTVLNADFGDGYDATSLIGSQDGVRSWTIKIEGLPADIAYGAISGSSKGSFPQSRADYLWKFFQTRMANGDESFIINDPYTEMDFLVHFVDHKLTYQMFTAKVFSTGLTLRQRRERAAGIVPPPPPPGGGPPTPAYQPKVYASFFNPPGPGLPVAETGQAWTNVGATWATRAYKARPSAISGGIPDGATKIPAGVSDCNINLVLDVAASTCGIMFRYSDDNHFLFVRFVPGSPSHAQIFKQNGTGFPAQVAAGDLPSPLQDGDKVTVQLAGASMIVRVNGVQVLTYSDSFNQGATVHGLYGDSVYARLKHFEINTDAPTTDRIRVTAPAAYKVFQRSAGNKADIKISGTYSGTPTGIEARFNGGAWANITASPSGGAFTGTLPAQAAGQGWLEVRFTNNPAAIDRVPYVGIGIVILNIGQSNAEGRFQHPNIYTHPALRCGVHDHGNDITGTGSWREAYDPTDTSALGSTPGALAGDDGYFNSMLPLLATEIMADQGLPVGFIASGHGATGLFGSGGTWQPGGNTYNEALGAVRNADPGGCEFIIWYDGESDSADGIIQSSLEAAISNLRAHLSTDLGFGALNMFITQLATLVADPVNRSNLDIVRIAQTHVVDSGVDANLFVGAILYDYDTRVGGAADGQHLNLQAHADGQAARLWQMIKFHLYGGTAGRGPRFLSATKPDSTHIDVRFTLSGSATLMTLAPPVAGWRVVDAVGVRTVTAAARLNDATIRLTLDQALSGAVTVSWASYNDAAGVVLTDSTAAAMPAEPFVNNPVS